MMNRTAKNCDAATPWRISIFDDQDSTVDGGYVIAVQMFQPKLGLCLAGWVVVVEDDTPFCDELVRNDLCMDTAVVRRLLALLYSTFRSADSGEFNVSLEDYLDDYMPVGGSEIKEMIRRFIHTFMEKA